MLPKFWDKINYQIMRINNFKLEEFFAKYEFSASYLLCASDCESFTVEELLSLDQESEKLLKKLELGYTESQGSPVLREEISNLYDDVMSENIIIRFLIK